MTKNEIIERIDKLETARFYLAMQDRWGAREFEKDNELYAEIQKLKAML